MVGSQSYCRFALFWVFPFFLVVFVIIPTLCCVGTGRLTGTGIGWCPTRYDRPMSVINCGGSWSGGGTVVLVDPEHWWYPGGAIVVALLVVDWVWFVGGVGGRKSSLNNVWSGVRGSTVRFPNRFSRVEEYCDGDAGTARRGVTEKLRNGQVNTRLISHTLASSSKRSGTSGIERTYSLPMLPSWGKDCGGCRSGW